MKCWLPDALTHISNTTVTWCRGIEVEDWRNKKCFPDPPKFVRSGNLDLCVWLGFVLVWVPAQLCPAAVWSAVVVNHDFVQNFPAIAGTQRHRDGMNIKHCKNVFIAKLGAAAGIRSYRGNTITAGRDRNWDLDSCQPLVCSKLPAGCLLCRQQWWGHTGWAGPCSTAAVSLSGDWEVPHCMQHPLITCSLTANCYMLSRAGVDILTVQG